VEELSHARNVPADLTAVLACSLLWNVTGMMSNSHFRVKLQLKADRANQVTLHCEHPTKNGAEPGGWMERESLSLQVCALLKIFAVGKTEKKGKFTLFSNHNGSLLRRQPGAKAFAVFTKS
jgi:hypothetical protein